MEKPIPRYVTRARGALLLQLPVEEVERISKAMGLGHVEFAGDSVERFLTYAEVAEIQKICLVAALLRTHASSRIEQKPQGAARASVTQSSAGSSDDTVETDYVAPEPEGSHA